MTDAVGWHSVIAESFQNKYRSHPDFLERKAVWARLIDRWMVTGARVLDAGCGAGTISALAAPKASSVVGFDGSAEMVALARALASASGHANAYYDVGRFETTPALHGSYDLVLCSSVIEYMPDPRASIGKLIEAVAASGVLILSLPNSESWYRRAERLSFQLRGTPRYLSHVFPTPDADTLDRILQGRGFEALATEYYGLGYQPITKTLRRLGCRREIDTLFAKVYRRINVTSQS